MRCETQPLPDNREEAAVEVLRRLYAGDAPEPLMEYDMVVEWVDQEIAAFVRKFGPISQGR